jgi:aminoglycoside phosphotransferase (APT) family kinase protein
MQQRHAEEWLQYFANSGYTDVEPLASGMEGAVYKLGRDLVGKVWARRKPDELMRLRDLYSDLIAADLPFATPMIQEVVAVDSATITIERELHGTPLQESLSAEDIAPRDEAVDCVVGVLYALRSVRETACMRELAVLDESQSLWSGNRNWSNALISLMERRVQKFGDQLRAHVENFDAKYSRIIEKVAGYTCEHLTAIHGDLCGVNILVDSTCKTSAVLDFGFLSTAGDPAFDTAIAAAIFNMYGPHARSIADTLTSRFAQEFGHSINLLLLYQAVYAIISSNAYDPLGRDGHFAWCAAILNRVD